MPARSTSAACKCAAIPSAWSSDGRQLIRDVDYRIDYELGRLTFARPETLFTRQRAVTVKFEENPLFAVGSTKLFGLTSTLALANGEVNFMALQQSQADRLHTSAAWLRSPRRRSSPA
jgi:cell surface protein SprA